VLQLLEEQPVREHEQISVLPVLGLIFERLYRACHHLLPFHLQPFVVLLSYRVDYYFLKQVGELALFSVLALVGRDLLEQHTNLPIE
jgi:hypothetical protein